MQKREKKPDNTYFHKICGIIDGINGPAGKTVCTGIIISFSQPTSTIRRLAELKYARNGVAIITIDYKELCSLVHERVNLLEMIERKRDEIITAATTDLQAAGTFNA